MAIDKEIACSFRHELKYLCSEFDMKVMECAVRCICRKDIHVGESGGYRIRSIYFDTPEDEAYLENLDGYTDREKYRIRIYNASDRFIKLEKKSTRYGMKRKEECGISRRQCENLLSGQPVRDCSESQKLLRQFLCERAEKCLKPKVIVEYARTPYIYPIGNVRITFDRNITSVIGGNADFFAAVLPGRAILRPDQHILEVKYDEVIPSAVMDCVNGMESLCRISFSKYALCRQYGGKHGICI